MIYIELNDPVTGKHYNLTPKRLKLGMVSSFDTHSMCAKVERITKKLDALHVQTGPSLSKYKGFRRNSSVTKTFHFSNLISTQDFFCIQHATFKATY